MTTWYLFFTVTIAMDELNSSTVHLHLSKPAESVKGGPARPLSPAPVAPVFLHVAGRADFKALPQSRFFRTLKAKRTIIKQEGGKYGESRLVKMPRRESIPGKVSGAWVLKGTRMPVSAIFENLEAGANIDDIMEWFDGLDREQVKAVIEFAVRSLDKAPVYAP